MAKRTSYTISNSFAAGQLSEAAQDAIGIDVWSAGLARASNVAIQRDGGLRTRAPFVRPVEELPVPDLSVVKSWSSDARYTLHTLARGTLAAGDLGPPVLAPGSRLAIETGLGVGSVPLAARVRAISGDETKAFLRIDLAGAMRLRALTLHRCRLSEGAWKGSDDKLVFEVWVERSGGSFTKLSSGDDPFQPWNFAPGRVSRDITIQLDRGGVNQPVPYTDIEAVELRLRDPNVAFPVELKLTGVSAFADEFLTANERTVLVAGGADVLASPPEPCWRLVPWVLKGIPLALALGCQGIRVFQFNNDGTLGALLHGGPGEDSSLGEWYFTPRQLRELTWAVFRTDVLLFHEDFPHPLRVRLQPFGVTALDLENIPDARAETVDAAVREVDTGGGKLRISSPSGARLIPQGVGVELGVNEVRVTWADSEAMSYDVMWDTFSSYDADRDAWVAARNNTVNLSNVPGDKTNTTATDYTITGLSGSTHYVAAVRANYSSGPSDPSRVLSFSPYSHATGKLAGLAATVTATAVEGQIVLSWDSLANAESYQVQFRIAGLGLPWRDTEVQPGPNNRGGLFREVDFTGTGGVQYDFRARGHFSGGRVGEWSDEVRQVAPGVIGKGAGLTARAGDSDGEVVLSWSSVAGAASYEYRWRTGGGAFTTVASPEISDTFNGTAGTAYDFQVRALDSFSRTGDWSDIVTFTAQNAAAGVPGSLSARASRTNPGRVDVAWASVPGANGYQIRYRLSDVLTWTESAAIRATSTTFTGTPNEVYEVQVRSRRPNAANSPWSAGVVVSLGSGPIPAPRGLVASNDEDVDGRINLSWGAVSTATGYQIRHRAGTSGAYTEGAVITGTTAVFNGTVGTTYQFNVRAVRTGDPSSTWSQFTSIQATLAAVPVPASLTANPSTTHNGRIFLSWAAVPRATGYRVRSRAAGEAWREEAAAGTTLTFTRTGGTTYEFQVRAERGSTVSAWSSSVSRMAPLIQHPGIPTDLAAVADEDTNGQVNVSWTARPLADGYQVRWRVFGTANWTNGSVQAGTSAALSLSAGTTYEISVRARRSVYWSDWAQRIRVQAGVSAARPPVPTGLVVDTDPYRSRTIRATWTRVAEARFTTPTNRTIYQVRWRWRTGNAAWTAWSNGPSWFVIDGFTPTFRVISESLGQTVEVQVRSRKQHPTSASGSWLDSAWSGGRSAVTVDLPIDAPLNVRYRALPAAERISGNYGVSFQWDPVDGATEYEYRWRQQTSALPNPITPNAPLPTYTAWSAPISVGAEHYGYQAGTLSQFNARLPVQVDVRAKKPGNTSEWSWVAYQAFFTDAANLS